MNLKKFLFPAFFAFAIFASTPSIAAPAAPIEIEAEAEENFDLKGKVVLEGTAKTAPVFVLLGHQNGKPHLSLAFSGDALILNRVVNGRAAMLATVKKGYAPAKGSTPFVLQWREGSLRVVWNGLTILRKDKLGELKGAIAISPDNAGLKIIEPEVQPVEPVEFADDFMRNATVTGLWEDVVGTWKLAATGDANLGANPFSFLAQGKPAISTTGRWFWSDYAASVSVRPGGEGAIGIIAYWQDDKNYLLCKWMSANAPGSPNTKKQLWKVVNGVPNIIAAAPGGYHPKQWYRVSLSAANGVIKMLVDGNKALEKQTDLFGQGKIGLFSEGDAEAMFDDVQVQPADEVEVFEDTAAADPSRFDNDQSMQEWASPKGQWLPVEATSPNTHWNRGMFFGDYAAEIKVAGIMNPNAKAQVILAGDGATAESGYVLQVAPASDNKSVQSVLMKSGKPISEPVVTTLNDAAMFSLKLQRVGNKIQGLIDKTLVAEKVDAKPLQGRRAGFTAEAATVALETAVVSGGNVTDYRFFRAPTDWEVGSGTWDMASRWLCTPGWSWYGGWSDRIAAVWNKKSFSGDFAIEVFAASKMDSPDHPFYLHPRDLNITISGDGKDLASGYSFIFGGWNNTSTRIMRGTQVVAETDKILLPTSATYHQTAHHKWFSLRVEKTGDLFSYYIDRKLALQFKDPKPLTGKRLALWTSGNGMVIARATVSDEKKGTSEILPVSVALDNSALAAPVENLHWEVRLADTTVALSAIAPAKPTEHPAIRVVNLEGGGNFAIKPQIEPLDVSKTPKLSFQARFEPGVQANLYLRVKDLIHVVRLNGSLIEQDAENAKSLGDFPIAADGKWHNVKLDLASLLKPIYPDETALSLEEIFIGNLTRDAYLQAGFGANAPGSSYQIRDFSLSSADGKIVNRIEPQLKAQPKPAAPPKTKISKKP